jgi:MFS family permease
MPRGAIQRSIVIRSRSATQIDLSIMDALHTSRLFKMVASPALLFAVLSSVLALAVFRYISEASLSRAIGVTIIIVAPDALAACWLFRRLRTQRSAPDARRGAIAFAFSVPIVMSVAYVLGELVGGYAEAFLGRVFIFPAIILFIAILVVTIPGVIVRWALHSSAGVTPINEGPQ